MLFSIQSSKHHSPVPSNPQKNAGQWKKETFVTMSITHFSHNSPASKTFGKGERGFCTMSWTILQLMEINPFQRWTHSHCMSYSHLGCMGRGKVWAGGQWPTGVGVQVMYFWAVKRPSFYQVVSPDEERKLVKVSDGLLCVQFGSFNLATPKGSSYWYRIIWWYNPRGTLHFFSAR